ncbi:hypothetical protein NDU88_004083 [Pleurodeles waltl]|uniref:Uncharacterized protein n=1 Tax=Pleurodeles waltl TaxID=8319 RepID=A0AAV7L3M2_PLEWA|nr:hypothetical protein NDU88_004083 [Pleurodeles waltl]
MTVISGIRGRRAACGCVWHAMNSRAALHAPCGVIHPLLEQLRRSLSRPLIREPVYVMPTPDGEGHRFPGGRGAID